MRRSIIAATLLALAVPAQAFAHPEVERAAVEVREGNYEAAAPRLDELLAGSELDLEELTSVLELRAMLFRASGDDEALERSLRALASIAPGHRWPPEYPPDLEARSMQIQAHSLPLRIDTQVLPSSDGVRLSALVENDPAELVRELRYRVLMGAEWSVVTPPVSASPGRQTLAIVEAIGPGGAVVAVAGSTRDPLRVSGTTLDADRPLDPPGSDDWVPWLIGGVVLAVIAGVAIGLGVGLSENATVTWVPSEPRELP